jgi:hypothetical protein
MVADLEKSVVDDEFQDVRSDVQSPQPFEESSAESQPGNSDSWFNNITNMKVKVLKMVSNASNYVQKVKVPKMVSNASNYLLKVKVLKMVSNASNYFQNLFGHSSAESTSSDANGNTSSTLTDKTIEAIFIKLALMVVMVVVLKRVV